MSEKMNLEIAQSVINARADIQLNLIEKYPEYKGELTKLQINCKEKIFDLNKKHPDWFDKKDIRINVLIKQLSIVSSTKLAFLQSKLFVSMENWVDLFLEEVIPKPVLIDIGQIGYVRELDTTIKFSFYQRLFSNLEASIKMIASTCPGAAQDYKGFITQFLKIREENDGFLNVMKWVRNSIHNNGIHIPDNSRHDNLTYTY